MVVAKFILLVKWYRVSQMSNQEKEQYRNKCNWRWESDDLQNRPKISKGKNRQNSKQLIKSGQFDADELYEDET